MVNVVLADCTAMSLRTYGDGGGFVSQVRGLVDIWGGILSWFLALLIEQRIGATY